MTIARSVRFVDPISDPVAAELFQHIGMLTESLEAQFPTLCHTTRKQYRRVDEFHDYRYSQLRWLTGLSFWLEPCLPVGLGSHERMSEAALGSLLAERRGFPIFFVKIGLLRAAMLTETLTLVDWESMPFPFESFSFVLPKGGLRNDGHDILYVSVVKARPGIFSRPGSAITINVDQQKASLYLVATNDRGEEYSLCLTQAYQTGTEFTRRFAKDSKGYLDMREAEHAFTNKVLPALVFNLLFAMAARPEYIELGHATGTNKKSGRELWTPNIIGRKYATKRDPNAETGTHASPRMHWRRGHFRQQFYGIGRTEKKIIWIEPTLISPQSKGASNGTN